MFPLVAILIAAGLVFKLKRKPAATAASPAKPASTSSAPKATIPVVKPATSKKAPVKATPQPKASQNNIEGYVTPGINAQVNDLLGQWANTNPKVLSQTLPIGQYNPATNSAGYETPPIVAQPTYTRY